jgi:hypothetical protein
LLNGQVGPIRTLEDAIDVDHCLLEKLEKIDAIAQ